MGIKKSYLDPNLIPANIKQGVTVLGTVGSLVQNSLVANDTVVYDNATANGTFVSRSSTTSTTPIVFTKKFYPNANGTFRLKVSAKTLNGGSLDSKFQIYKNGVPYGTVQTVTNTSSYLTSTFDLTAVIGDYWEVYGWINTDTTLYINNVQVCFTPLHYVV